MLNYISFIKKYKKPLIGLLIVLNILALVGISKLNINAEFNIFKVDNSAYQEQMDEMQTIFGGENQVLLLLEVTGSIEETMAVTRQVLDQYPLDYIDPQRLIDMAPSTPSLSPIHYKDQKTYVSFMLDLEEAFDFKSLMEALQGQDLVYFLSGDAYMQFEIVNLITKVLTLIPPLALFLVLLTFRTQLASVKASLLSVVPAGLAALWTLGLIGWFSSQVSIITVLAPIFAIVIGSADGLHFISHMEEALDDQEPDQALGHTLTILGLPMIITTTTSVAGFLGLMMIDTSAIKSLAAFAALGVAMAGIITFYVLPLVFTSGVTLKHKNHQPKTNGLKRLWGKKSILISLLMVLLATSMVGHIKTEFNPLMFFRDYTRVQKNFDQILAINDGALPLYYYGHQPLEDILQVLPEIDESLQGLEGAKPVKKVMNPLSALDLEKGLDIKNLQSAKAFIRLRDKTLYYRFIVFPQDLTNKNIAALEDLTDQDPWGDLLGSQLLMKEMNQGMVKGQVLSIGATFLMIFLMLILALRSFKLSLIASLPVLLTTFILYGFLGASGISLNLMTCTIFSIGLGIGVDYAIHFSSTYKYYLDHGHKAPKHMAFKYSARPIIANAIGLSLGLSALWLSPLLFHLHLSILMWASMLLAVFMSLTLLPSLLPKDKSH